MLAIASNIRIFLCLDPIDMRKGFLGLSAAVEKYFDEDLTEGAYFVFLNKWRNHMKILYWDNDGLAIWSKRLEKGRFPKQCESILNRREFLMLIEGITPKKLEKRFNFSK